MAKESEVTKNEQQVNVSIVKLVTGEELIAGVIVNVESGIVQVNFPACAYPMPDGNVRLRPWMLCRENLTADGWIDLSPMSIITICTPVQDIEDAYIELKEKHFSAIHKPSKEEQKLILSGNNTLH